MLTITWEEIADIKIFGTLGGGWIFFSTSNLTGKKLEKCRSSKNTIFMRIGSNPQFLEAVKYYSNDILQNKDKYPSLAQSNIKLPNNN